MFNASLFSCPPSVIFGDAVGRSSDVRYLHLRWAIALIVFVVVLLIPVILSMISAASASAMGCSSLPLPC